MGGFHKTLGQVYKPIRKIVDPLNIMDPFRILPGSSAGFTNKPFTFDKNFALGLFNAPKNQGTYTPMTKGLSSNPQYFAQQQQMLNNMRQQQQAKLANLQSQGQAYPTTAATQSVETAQAPTTTTTTPVALAQSKVSDTTAPADMPTEFIYKPATAQTKTVAANTFQMPDMSSIKFGGA
jgi:hypothetical protein